jgi:hypothetical protein
MSSIAANRETIAPSFASSRDPKAKVVVQTISMAIGIEATRRTTVNDKALRTSSPDDRRYPKAIPHRDMDKKTNTTIILMSNLSKFELSSPPCNKAAVRPKKVLAPVHSTVPSTSPLTTVEPILTLSPLKKVTGRDSPVSAA